MTADEFIAAIADTGRGPGGDPSWAGVRRRPRPAFDHPDDPVLGLLARYDLSGVAFWHLRFAAPTGPDVGGLWHVASKATDDFYVGSGLLLKMYYKEDWPRETGLTSGQFLAIVAVYAGMIAARAADADAPRGPVVAAFAARAAAVSPDAAHLGWFQ